MHEFLKTELLQVQLNPIACRRKPDSLVQSVKVVEAREAVSVLIKMLAIIADKIAREVADMLDVSDYVRVGVLLRSQEDIEVDIGIHEQGGDLINVMGFVFLDCFKHFFIAFNFFIEHPVNGFLPFKFN